MEAVSMGQLATRNSARRRSAVASNCACMWLESAISTPRVPLGAVDEVMKWLVQVLIARKIVGNSESRSQGKLEQNVCSALKLGIRFLSCRIGGRAWQCCGSMGRVVRIKPASAPDL